MLKIDRHIKQNLSLRPPPCIKRPFQSFGTAVKSSISWDGKIRGSHDNSVIICSVHSFVWFMWEVKALNLPCELIILKAHINDGSFSCFSLEFWMNILLNDVFMHFRAILLKLSHETITMIKINNGIKIISMICKRHKLSSKPLP